VTEGEAPGFEVADFSGIAELRRRAERSLQSGASPEEIDDRPTVQEISEARLEASRLAEEADREAHSREEGHLRQRIIDSGSAKELEASDRRAEDCRRHAAIGTSLAEALEHLGRRIQKIEELQQIPEMLEEMPALVEAAERARERFEVARHKLHAHGIKLQTAYDHRGSKRVPGVDPDIVHRANRAIGDPARLIGAPVVEWNGPDDPPVSTGRGGWQYPPDQSPEWRKWYERHGPVAAATGVPGADDPTRAARARGGVYPEE